MSDRPVALVTGASRGIGLGIATKLEAAGFATARTARSWDEPGAGRFAADVADLDSHAGLVRDVVAGFGRIDCLVNNAGIGSPMRGDFAQMAPETFDMVMSVNLRGTVFFTQAVMRAMLADKTTKHLRSIIFVTSASATAASPERLDYCMSKAALAMFVKGLALRLAGESISVFEVRPGIIRTDMTSGVTAKYDRLIAEGVVPERRWGEPDDIASIVAALAGGAFPFSTGTVVDAGGGLTIPRL
ncbi:MAG: 3-ketoacyl-ACP reductase [Rhizobiales bacterium]|nr:3-ketoacyl-ACP reductase [Hyphomicrobiales bacterium]MBI3674788.1 3-ketoacyl-ACP reductase [Hyphomicrobiales bacterium]